MQYSSRPLFGGDDSQSEIEREQTSQTTSRTGNTYDTQFSDVDTKKNAVPAGSAVITAGSDSGHNRPEGKEWSQTGYDGSHTDNNSDHQAPAVTSQASRSQQPSWASSAPSAGWSTSSPAAGWGSSTGTGKQLSGNQTEGSSGQGFLQKAQESLPGLSTGQTGSAAESGTQDASKDGSQQSLLDKAKEYLPGSSSTKTTDSAWKSDSSQLQEREQMPDIPVGSKQAGTYSRPGAEPVAVGTASAWHSDRDTSYSPDRMEKLSNEAGLTDNRSLQTSSNPDTFSSGQHAKVGQRNSGSSVTRDSGAAGGNGARTSERDSFSAQQGYSQNTGASSIPSQPRYSSVSTFGSNLGQGHNQANRRDGSAVQQNRNQSGDLGSNSGTSRYSQTSTFGSRPGQGHGQASSQDGDAVQQDRNQSGDLGSNSGTPKYSSVSSFASKPGQGYGQASSLKGSAAQQDRDQSGDLGSNSGTPRYSQTSTFGSNAAQPAYSQSGAGSSTSGTPRYSQTSTFGGSASQQDRHQSGVLGRQSGGAGSNLGQQAHGQSSASGGNASQQGYNQAGGYAEGQSVAAYDPVTRLPSTGIPPIFHPPSHLVSDVPSHGRTVITQGGNQGYQSGNQGWQSGSHAGNSGSDTEGVNAQQALQPLTEITALGAVSDVDEVNAKQALQPLTQVPAGDTSQDDAVHAKDALQPLTEVPAQEGKGIVESIMEYLPGQHQTGAVEQEQYSQQPGFFDRAKAYVPALHSSGHSHQTEGVPTHPQQTQYTTSETQYTEAQPTLLDKAKAYIPVLGSATDFDPAAEARMQQDDNLYQEIPEGDTGFEPESYAHESLLDKAKAYLPAMGAPGTTNAGIDANTGAGAGAPHKGLVEELVEKAKEYLPHQLTGVETESTASGGGYTGSTTTGYTGSTTGGYAGSTYAGSNASYTREVDPQIGGVRLSNRPILGGDVGPASYSHAADAEAPHSIVDKVKQLVGLGPTTDTSEDRYNGQGTQSFPITTPQGINGGAFVSSARVDSLDDDDDIFVDAPEDLESVSFTSTNTGYTQAPVETRYTQSPSHGGYTSNQKQPYVNQTGPPLVDTSNDPDDTFGPVKTRREPAQSAGNSNLRGPATFGDDDDYEGTPGKKGFRAKVKGKLGAKKEHHQEKKRSKANEELESKMQEKEIPKAQAVTTPAAPEQGTTAPTAGSNLGPGGGGGMMGGVAGGSPADPHGNAQSESKQDAAPATAKPATTHKTPHEAVKANEHAGGSNIRMGRDAQQKAEAAPPKKQKSGFMSKLKKPFSKS